MKKSALHFLTILVLTACIHPLQAYSQSKPMNFILIVADDMGWNQSGCYGSDFYETPNIDNLAQRGMRFTNAYSAAAVCSPTRASLITGKYPARLHITDFIPGHKTKEGQHLMLTDWQKYLPLHEISIAELFKSSNENYVTALYGKWHLSKDKKAPLSKSHNPNRQGFDDELITFKPNKTTDPEHDPHNSGLITNAAVKFLNHQSSNPFFLLVSYNAIHDPVMENQELIDKYSTKKGSGDTTSHPVIAAMMEQMDRGIGRILTRVDSLNLTNNTVIIFISDNGGHVRYASQAPLRAGKGWLYEGGIRVPMLISWPGITIPGSVSEDIVISNDIFHTIASYLNVTGISRTMDGIDLRPVLSKEKSTKERKVFWHYPHYHVGSGMKPGSAMRSGKYKLIEWHEPLLKGNPAAYELYKLDDDISEKYNIINERPEIAKSMMLELQEWKKEVGAQMPKLKFKVKM